jgi:hypothetical protein
LRSSPSSLGACGASSPRNYAADIYKQILRPDPTQSAEEPVFGGHLKMRFLDNGRREKLH